MTNSLLLTRVVETSGTYLVHSTIFLASAWLFFSAWSLRSRWNHAGRELQTTLAFEPHPLVLERVWKLAAVLALGTAPLSVFAGWSHSALRWSFDRSATIVAECTSPTKRPLEAENHHHPTVRITQRPRPIESDEAHPANESSRSKVLQPGGPDPATTLVLTKVLTLDNDGLKALDQAHVDHSDTQSSRSFARDLSVKDPSLDDHDARQTIHSESIGSMIDGIGIAIAAWFCWTVFRLGTRSFGLYWLIAGCNPIDGALRRELDRLTPRGSSIRLLRSHSTTPNMNRLGQSKLISEPFACGLFQWTIVLPEWTEQELANPELKALLAHEVAHLVRRDPVWQFIGELLCTCLAMQPLNFLARRQWQRATELLCDDWAVEQHVSATSLARCLTRIAESGLTGRAMKLGLSAVGQSGSLTDRIEWLLRCERPSKPTRRQGQAIIAVMTFATGLFVGMNGPHLSLVSSAEEIDDAEEVAVWKRVDREMTEIQQDLVRVEALLSDDVHAAALAANLRASADALKLRVNGLWLRISSRGD